MKLIPHPAYSPIESNNTSRLFACLAPGDFFLFPDRELPLSRTYLHGSKGVLDIEVLLYIVRDLHGF